MVTKSKIKLGSYAHARNASMLLDILNKMHSRTEEKIYALEAKVMNDTASNIQKQEFISYKAKRETLEGIIDIIDGIENSD